MVISFGNGLKMVIPKDMAWAFEGDNYYEKNIEYWLDRIIRKIKKPIFYDIGANYGYYSIKFSPLYEVCYAFEPVESTYSVLKSNIHKNRLRSTHALCLALSKKSGQGEINVYNSSGNNSTYERDIPRDHPTKFVRKEKIQFESLDNFVETNNALAPSLIKIDVEGGEMDVIDGAKRVIKKRMPIIVVEYSENTSRDAGYDRIEILNALEKFGYKVYGLSSEVVSARLYSPRTKDKTINIDNLLAVPPGMKI